MAIEINQEKKRSGVFIIQLSYHESAGLYYVSVLDEEKCLISVEAKKEHVLEASEVLGVVIHKF